MVVKALFALKGEISEPRIEAGEETKAEKRQAGSGRAGPAWEEEAFGDGPEEREEEIGDIEELEEPFNLIEDEGPGDVEDIEDQGFTLKDTGRSSRKRK